MNRVRLALLFLAGISAVNVWAQASDSAAPQTAPTPPAAPQAPAAAPAAPPGKSIFTVGKVDFSGSADFYYSFNNNHPAGGVNQLYNFDDKTDQFDLNMAKITANMDPAPIGFRVDLGLGRVFANLFPYGTPDPGFMRYVEQAYVSVKPKGMKGFEADLGQFVTSAGAEVIETKDDWNYSRSILFAWAIPYYHFGVRTSMPIGSSFTAGLQVVDGWNNIIEDNGKNMQTVGLVGNVTRKKFTWSNDFYTGPNVNGVNKGNRNLYDTTLLLTPSDKFNAYVNFDYAHQALISSGASHWVGVAAAARYQINKYLAFSPRVEVFDDPNGYSTGTDQRLHEFTLTGECKIHDGLITRLEYRHDTSDVPFYQRGKGPDYQTTQSTFTVGLIAFFAPKH